MSPQEEGIKLSSTVICLCPVKACLHIRAPVGWDDYWPLAGTPCGPSQTPHAAESIIRKIWMRNVSELHWLSGYRSKNRLEEAVLLHLSFISLHVKDNLREKNKRVSQSNKNNEGVLREIWGFFSSPKVKIMPQNSHACGICASQRALLYCIMHFPIPTAPH